MLNRRGFLGLLAAPAIVRVASIMPVVLLPLSLWEKQDELHRLWYGLYDKEVQRISTDAWRRYSPHPSHILDRWHMHFLTGQLGGPPDSSRAAAMAYAKRNGLLNPKLLAGSPYLTPDQWPGPYIDGTYHPEVKQRSPWHPERAAWVEGVPC